MAQDSGATNPPKGRKAKGDEVIARIQRNLGNLDRTPFTDVLATALGNAPSKTAWKKQAAADPHKWTQAVMNLGKMAGFSERQETIIRQPKPIEIARQLEARFGRKTAVAMLDRHGMGHLLGELVEGDTVSQS